MAIKVTISGNYAKTEQYFKKLQNGFDIRALDKYGEAGVKALSSATPLDTGETASSWSYRIRKGKNSVTIEWLNSNVVDGVPIAVILQYGHGTRNGGYVQGRDYINPALHSLFDQIANDAFRIIEK